MAAIAPQIKVLEKVLSELKCIGVRIWLDNKPTILVQNGFWDRDVGRCSELGAVTES